MSPLDADTSAGLSEVDLERSLKGERATSLSFPAGRLEPGTSSRASRVSPADPTPDAAPFVAVGMFRSAEKARAHLHSDFCSGLFSLNYLLV